MLTREADRFKIFSGDTMKDLMRYEMVEKNVSRDKKRVTAHMSKVLKLII